MTKINQNLTLGLDIGTSSIGWALVDHANKRIVDSGVRIFPVAQKDSSKQHPNQNRREKRQARRQRYRKRMRKDLLIQCLQKHGMFPITEGKALHNILTNLQAQRAQQKKANQQPTTPQSITLSELEAFFSQNPYMLRQRAAAGDKLTRLELGRALYHMAQRRGFPTNGLATDKKEGDAKVLKFGNIDSGQTGAEATQAAIHNKAKPITLGTYLARLHPGKGDLPVHFEAGRRIRARYTYRNMYEQEFKTIWDAQAAIIPSSLPKPLGNTSIISSFSNGHSSP